MKIAKYWYRVVLLQCHTAIFCGSQIVEAKFFVTDEQNDGTIVDSAKKTEGGNTHAEKSISNQFSIRVRRVIPAPICIPTNKRKIKEN